MNNKNCLNEQSARAGAFGRLGTACSKCYQRVSRRLAAIKEQVEREFSRAGRGYSQVLKSAINEAEALAWQTPYPHLFFPVLAEEKAAGAQRWAARQDLIRGRNPWPQPAA